MKNVNTVKKIITVMTILALLVMILPMSVVAKGNGKNVPAQASEKVKEAKVKPENVPVKSARAQLVAARNAWAKENDLPPGHANLIYKYILETKELSSIAINSRELFGEMVDKFITDEGLVDVQGLMEAVKQAKMLAEESEVELEEEKPEEDES